MALVVLTPVISFLLLVTSTAMLELHGYDNNELSMCPIFIASGPLVKRGHGIQLFVTVDYYKLFSAILGVAPEPNNETFANVRDVLKNPPAIT
jgi:hypothetical protein